MNAEDAAFFWDFALFAGIPMLVIGGLFLVFELEARRRRPGRRRRRRHHGINE